MPAPMHYRLGRAPEPLTEERLFNECAQGEHDKCAHFDVDDWGRLKSCTCPCHTETPTPGGRQKRQKQNSAYGQGGHDGLSATVAAKNG